MDTKTFFKYLFGGVIFVAVIAAIIWYVRGGWQYLSDPDFARGMLIFAISIAAAAVGLALVARIIFDGSGDRPTGTVLHKLTDAWVSMQPMQTVTVIVGLSTIGLIAWFSMTGSDFFSKSEQARALITFAVAIVTVAITMIMVSYVVIPDSKEDEEKLKARFGYGKDILMVFVGILGTIMGFYYGAGKVTPDEVKTIQQSSHDGGASATSVIETKAFDYLIKQNYGDAVQAFDLLSKATPPSPNTVNINAIVKELLEKKDGFVSPDDNIRNKTWKNLHCEISRNGRAAGQSKDVLDKFKSGCNDSVPSASPTATSTP